MKLFYSVIFFFLFTFVPVIAKDIVNTKNAAYEGKITSYSDGLIHLTVKGIAHSFVRSKNEYFFGDYLEIKTRPFKSKRKEIMCRVSFVDTFNVIYLTPVSRVQIPRYRVKTMVLDAK